MGESVMAKVLRCVFLNCCNLFPAGVVDRGPVDETQLQQKIKGLSSTLRLAFKDERPDLIGLCEVGTRNLASRLAKSVEPGAFKVN